MSEDLNNNNVKKNMNTLTQYGYDTWMCTGCGLKNAILDPFCVECESNRPELQVKRQTNAIKRQRAEQIQNNVNYNFSDYTDREPVIFYQQREQSDMEKSLLFGANLVTYVCLWIVALTAIFFTLLIGLGLYKAFF